MSEFLNTVFALYFISVVCAACRFSWQFAKEHGFLAWMFLGEIVPPAEAVLWPCYRFGSGKGPQTKGQSKPAWLPVNADELIAGAQLEGRGRARRESSQTVQAYEMR